MEKELKFKKEWFDVLNQVSLEIRTDVMEAVFQYFFTGAEPNFTDEARRLAFGFIRADIDATRRRREARLARKNKTRQPAPQNAAATPAPAPTATPNTEPYLSNDEVQKLNTLVKNWNDAVRGSNVATIKNTLPLTDPIYAPALNALRRVPFNRICIAIERLHFDKLKPGFEDFFNELQ